MCQDCAVLHDRLQKMGYELFQMKRANTRLKGELRAARQDKAKLIKEKKEKDYYRNGQKRGRNGRHG